MSTFWGIGGSLQIPIWDKTATHGIPPSSHLGQNCHPHGSLQGPLWDEIVTHRGPFKVHWGTKLSPTGPSKVPYGTKLFWGSLQKVPYETKLFVMGSLQPFRCLDMYPPKMIFNQLYMHEKEICIFENSMKMISLMNYLCTRLPLQ